MITAIVVPVYNAVDMTRLFLRQVLPMYSDKDDVYVIVVDNNSSDGTHEFLRGVDGIHVISNGENRGYGAACNQGADYATKELFADLLIFINNDIRVSGDFVMMTRQWAAQFPADLMGARLIRHHTGWNTFGGETVRYLEGWYLAMTAELYAETGGFDELFSPCDYEDLDLSVYVEKLGHALRQIQVPVSHLGNRSGVLLPSRKKITEENRIKFANKWGLSHA